MRGDLMIIFFSPVLAEKLQLESTNKSISEIEVPEVKPAIFQQIIGMLRIVF